MSATQTFALPSLSPFPALPAPEPRPDPRALATAAWECLTDHGPDLVVKGVALSEVRRRLERGCLKDRERTVARYEQAFRSAQALVDAGFGERFTLSSYWASIDFTLDDLPRDLPRLRQALGPWRISSKQVEDSKKRTVRVHLSFPAHPDVSVSYVRKLPRPRKGQPAPKCKFVRKVRTSYELVCEQ